MKKLLMTLCFCVTSVYGATFTVLNNSDAGLGSLRQAILDANAAPGADVISFSGPFSIVLLTPLPNLTGPTAINGGFSSGPQVEINGTTNSVAGAGLIVAASASGSSIQGLNIHGFAGQGILIAASNVTVSGCYIGTNLTGLLDRGNAGSGIEVAASLSNILIGGSTPDSSNIISGNNAVGINVANNCNTIRIAGNKIGVDVSGNLALANNQFGILLNAATNVTIGGSGINEGNIISANGLNGISINTGTGIRILGNLIGVGADGTTNRGNGGHGIMLSVCTNTQIGGSFHTKNVISCNNSNGIEVNNCSALTIQFNYIGTSRTGLIARGNISHGIQLNGTNSSVVIGGSRYVHGNIISSNQGAGINFQDPSNSGKAPSNGTIIKGNLIGTDSTATVDLGNNLIGIILKSDNCVIGDTANEEGNVLAGTNIFCGLLIANGNNNIVRGNYIGVGLDEVTQIPNFQDGINVSVENAGLTASGNLIQYNTIAYNRRHGVNVGTALNNFVSTNELGNVVRFNKIYCNSSQGIFLNKSTANTRGNNGNETPVIDGVSTTANMLVGVANAQWANEKIDIYLIVDCPTCDVNPQGKIWVDSTIANASGAWSYDYFAKFGTTIPGKAVVTATDAAGNTSEFSLCCQALSGTSLVSSANPVCQGTTFSITYSNGQKGDSLMLQRSLNGTSWSNDRAVALTDPATISNIGLTDTSWFRFIAYSNGPLATAQCTDTSTSIKVNYVLSPNAGSIVFTSNDSICSGGAFDLASSGTYGTLQWQQSNSGGTFSNISGATTASFSQAPLLGDSPVRYRLVAAEAPCGTDTSNVLIGTIIGIRSGSISGPELKCDETQVNLSLNGYAGRIQWQDSTSGSTWNSIGNGSDVLTYTSSGIVATDFIRVVVSDSTGLCSSVITPIWIVESDTCSDPLPIEIANAMTPNGDGSNDVFYIKNIESYPKNRLIIYNRWGNKVYDATGYLNQWDGEGLPEATYYYLLELGLDVNGNEAEKNKYEGTLTILKR
jgi:gliding motility-associated-like protein